MDLIERAAQKAKEKKKKASSLVERAAAKSSESPAKSAGVGIGIGQPRENKPDPSSLNPQGTDSAKPRVSKGIGSPGARPTEKEPRPKEQGEAVAERKSLAIGIGRSEKKNLSDQPDTPIEPLKQAASTSSTPSPAAAPAPAPKKKSSRTEEVDLIALRDAGYITPDMPPNLMSEEFRIIKRSLLLNAFSKGDKKKSNSNIVLVTSSNPGEGKTFCTINLALSIATEQDVTVLLIDADFSKPEILNRLGVAGGRGLMDVVADSDLEVGDCLIRTNIPNLVLLPAGRQHNLTTELLASERMEQIVNEISTRYPDRLVIFDSPPVLASSAASVLALYMGQIVFVIEAEKTTEPQIKESLTMISACENINLLLNKTRYSGSNKKFASYYGYGGR